MLEKSMNPINWIYNAVRSAVRRGFEDALAEFAPDAHVAPAFSPTPAALPAAPEPEPAPKPKKGTRAAE